MSDLDNLTNELNIKELAELIRVAETAERYENMCSFVTKLVQLKSTKSEDLDVDERNLLSVAYKNVVGTKRASWRTLSGGFDDVDEDLVNKYKNIVENELEIICQQLLDLLIKYLCKNVEGNNDETEVFYLKMVGDYYRYLAEIRTNQDKYKNLAEEYYKKAMEIAVSNLNETHPTRLGLALNFSVFYTEIAKEPEKACALAKRAFDSSIEKLDTLNDASYKDSTLIMQLLRDNLTLWTGNNDDGVDGVDDGTIGFAVGGAKDVNNFRQLLDKNSMPSITSITYNGLLYEYYFDTKKRAHDDNKNNALDDNKQENDDVDDGSSLFYPSYCYAQVNKLEVGDNDNKNEEGDECEYYMTVGLNSNIKEKDFKRKKLNLIIILDKSGSMSCCFPGENNKSKMDVANEAVVSLLKHLEPDDRFSFITFDNNVQMVQQIDFIKNINLDTLKNKILSVKYGGENEFVLAYKEAVKYYDNLFKEKEYDNKYGMQYENRIIFVTDAQIHIGCSDPNLLKYVKNDAENRETNRIYTTFIGVGLDFYSNLCEQISSTRGCNYYSVMNTNDFIKQMDDDFNYMVTPLVFNVCLKLKSEGDACFIDKVYGTTTSKEEEMKKTGEITKIHTLFPTKKNASKGGTKGGIQLIKLKNNKNTENNGGRFNVEIEVTFEDKYGKLYKNTQFFTFKSDVNTDNDMIEINNYYDNIGIRKAILLCKYVELLINWIKYENEENNNNGGDTLQISDKHKKLLNAFIPHFEKEMKECNDNELQKELDILRKLVNIQ